MYTEEPLQVGCGVALAISVQQKTFILLFLNQNYQEQQQTWIMKVYELTRMTGSRFLISNRYTLNLCPTAKCLIYTDKKYIQSKKVTQPKKIFSSVMMAEV